MLGLSIVSDIPRISNDLPSNCGMQPARAISSQAAAAPASSAVPGTGAASSHDSLTCHVTDH